MTRGHYRLLVAALGALLLAACSQVQQAAQPSTVSGDYTEQVSTTQQSDYALVTFTLDAVAVNPGTRPAKGNKLDANDAKVKVYKGQLENQHTNFRAYLKKAAPKAQVVGDFYYLLNGVVVKLNGHGLSALAQGPGVKASDFSWLYRPTMNISWGIIGADTLESMGYTGAGIKVGVIDSGIDETSPFFACKGSIQHKVFASGVAYGYAPDTLLVNEHGTHVAGTIAGCDYTFSSGPMAGRTIKGVAPGAELYDYNVFPGFGGGYVAFGGSAFSHDIAQALEEALMDGMDVVNMSLGGGVQGPHDFLAEAVNAAASAGMVVVVAAGNEGPGKYTLSSPGSAAKAITVGASTNPHYIGVTINLADGSSYGAALGDFNGFAPPVSGAAFAVASPANGCTAVGAGVSGKIAIIDRGACTFTTKVRNAQSAGAIGVIVVNNAPGDPIAMGQDGTTPVPAIPAVMVAQDDGPGLKAKAGITTMSVDGTSPTEIVSSNADYLARFSSRGPVPYTGIIKPDVVAPGVNILSSVFDGKFAFFQGTSMATPHVTGSVALLLQAHSGWSPEDVKSALVNTADRPPHLESSLAGGTLVGLSAVQRGGGRINLPKANGVNVLISPSSVSFGYHNLGGLSQVSSVTLNLRSVSGASISCSATTDSSSVTLSAPAVTVNPSGTLTVSLNNPTGRSGDEEGEITLSCGGQELRIPWGSYLNPPGKG